MKLLTYLSTAAAILSLGACAIFQNPTYSTLFYEGVISTSLQYLVPKPMVHEVAVDFNKAGDLYAKFVGPDGSIPTPEQATALLNEYLPATPNKPLAVGTIMTIYWTYYPTWSKYSLKDQSAQIQAFLTASKVASAPYL